MSLLRKTLAAVLALAAFATALPAATTLVDDTFADGSSHNQDIANNSLVIYSGRSGNAAYPRTSAVGSLTIGPMTSGSSEAFFGYFTGTQATVTGSTLYPAPSTIGGAWSNMTNQSLEVGDSLEVSMVVNFTGLVSGQSAAFGVLDSKATRRVGALTGGHNAAEFADDTGYSLQIFTSGSSTTPLPIGKRDLSLTVSTSTTNNMFNNMAAFPNLTAFGSGNASAIQPLSSGVDYTITYTIQRTAADTNVITASIAGSDLTAYQAQATDTSSINTTFDSFALRWSGNAFTSSATLKRVKVVFQPALPVITAQPTFTGGVTTLSIGTGGQTTLSVTATGSALTYQWKKDGNAISGATASTLALTNLQLADSGSYTVDITNGGGTLPSNPAVLTVTSGSVNPPPVIVTPPASQTVVNGTNVTLSVTATGNALTYQWQKNTVAISGATSATLALNNIQPADAGSYTVTVSNDGGNLTSAAATVAVLSPVLTTSSFSPLAAATAINPDTPLRLTFASAPSFGTAGTIRIYDASNDSVVDTIDMASPAVTGNISYLSGVPYQSKTIGGLANINYYPVILSGNTATIYPRNGSLSYNKTYYVRIDRGAFKDSQGDFAGINDNTTWTFSTKTAAPALGTLVTVAADGSADFNTVQGALDFVPAGSTARTISIKNGTYFEQIYFTGRNNLTILGESADNTVIVYPTNNTFNNASGTYRRGTFLAQSVNGLVLANLTIRNSTPQNGSQAEALIIKGSATTGRNLAVGIKLYSYQDTLQVDGQFYMADSYIEGDVDFLWGNGPSFFRNCDFKILRTGGYFAQVRNSSGNHGFVFHNCRFTAAAGITGTFFNRIDPNSGQYPNSEMVLLDSVIGDATNNSFLNTNVGVSGSSYQTGWWLLNNVSADVATVHHWDNNSVDKDGAALTFASRPASTIMPTDATTQANYRDAFWVLNTTIAGAATAGTWTPALSPLFLTHPAAASVNAGDPITLTASTAAIPSATYQWKKDGNDISGATSATYTIANATGTDSGTYTVVATNASGSSTSNPAAVTVSGTVVAPTITTHPGSQSVTVGTNVTFTVAASGTAPFTYQWKKDGNDISGATSASLLLSNTLIADSGAYTVVVTNSAGSATSNAATLAVNGTAGLSSPDGFAASVTGGAAGPTVTVTTAAALEQYAEAPASSPYVIVVSGTIDLGLNGRINVTSNKTIKGENTASTILGSLTIGNATNVIVSNLNISANTGDPAANDGITVAASTYVLVTKCTIFDCTDGNLDVINGSDFVTVSWCKFYYTRNNGHNFSNLIGSSDTDTGAGGQYRVTWHHNWWSTGAKQRMLACRFGGSHMFNNYWDCSGNDYCTESRNIAEMLSEHNSYNGVDDPIAKRTATSADQSKLMTIGNLFTNCTGSQVVSTDTVFTPPYSYPLYDATAVAAIVQAGAGNVAVDAPAPAGSAAITGATSVATGASVTLTAAPTGFTPASYQWRFKNAAISGATSATYTIPAAALTDAGDYSVVIGLAGGNAVVSSPLTLAVTAAPTLPAITTQPASLTVNVGASASFSVTATGTGLTYQWKKDTADIAGATSASYTISAAALTDAASYTVVVTNSAGSVTSTAATLTVAPAFTAPVAYGYGSSATGGGSATQVVVSTAADFRTQAESTTAAVITVSGTLNLGTTKVAVKSNKTIQGIDANATLVGNLELASGVTNVVIRGLNLTNPGTSGGDGLTLTGATNVFITHVTFFDCANTLLRIVGGADNITVSWCEFYYTTAQTANRHATLIGASTGETKALRVTLDHNWYSDRVDQQQPDSTWGHVHLYNNYFNPNGTANTSGSIARANAQFLSERNQYTSIVSPLTKTGGGLIRANGNVYTSTTGTAADAGTDTVFTPSYSYHLHATADLPAFLLAGAGNTAGGASATLAAGSASITASATTVTAGSSFTLTASTAISAVTGWQWRLNNADIAGATSLAYTVSSAQSANAGTYTVAALNAAGEAIVSTPVTITVNPAPVTPPPPSGGGGGGGSPSLWFLGALALLTTLRRLIRHDS